MMNRSSLASVSGAAKEQAIDVVASRRARRLHVLSSRGAAYAVVSFVTLLSVLPTFYMVDLSLRDPIASFAPVLIAGHPILDNYQMVLQSADMYRYFVNSTVVSLCSVVLTIIVVLLSAFGLSRLRIRGGTVVFYLLISGLMIPLASLIVPLTVELKNMGMLNTYWGLIGPFTAIGTPFGLLVIKGAMDNFPRELEEAAVLDGAAAWHVLWRVIVPVIRPSILVVAIWQFLYSWNEFFLSLVVMTDASMKTVPLLPLQFEGPFMTDPGALFAVLTLVSVVPMLVYAALQRWFVGGLMTGSVKG